MTINVYSYLGQLKKTNIGRVFVNDPDDWDLPDKTFTARSSPRYFTVSNSGSVCFLNAILILSVYRLLLKQKLHPEHTPLKSM